MKIPVVLSTVHVNVDTEGVLSVDIDGQPYVEDRQLRRADLRPILDKVTTDRETGVRVEIREADGTTYADIATPPESPSSPASLPAPVAAQQPGVLRAHTLGGAGFRPGEEVALAYVVARKPADSDGNASINLPPAVLAATHSGLVLLGLTSHKFAQVEAPA